jgi:outer membrane protein assembly factor BamB
MRLLPLFALAACAATAADWTRFRGPNGTGISNDAPLPSEIGPTTNVAWKAATPKGNSSPIVVKDRVYITGWEGDERIVLCFDAKTGAPVWRKSVTKLRSEPPNPLNGPTTPTLATGDNAVFAFFPEFGLISYDLDGKELWRVPLGPFGGIQGMAVSPIYTEGNIVLLIDTPEQAYLAAWNAKTGKQAWKTERPIGWLGSYATPSLYKPANGPEQIIVAGAVELTGYQAKTGERIWWARGVTMGPAVLPLVHGDSVYTLEPASGDAAGPFAPMLGQFDKDKDGKIQLATEVVGESVNVKIMQRLLPSIDRVTGNNDGVLTEDEWNKSFAPAEKTGGLVRVKLGGKGDVTATHIAWRYTRGLPYVLAPLLYQNVLYVIRNGGILATIDPESGKMLNEARLKDAIGEYYAQPVAGDGKIYFISKDGKASVIKAGEKWELLSSGNFDAQVIATPAIANGRIYVRTSEALYSFAPRT